MEIVNTNTLWDDLRKKENKKIEEEKITGIPHSEFLALMNLSYEFNKWHSENEIIEMWLDYRVNLQLGNIYHQDPYKFSGWHKINNPHFMEEVMSTGGAFLTWHYGDYRHIFTSMVDKLQKVNKKMFLVVDSDSYKHNKQLKEWEQLREKSNINMLNSEDYSTGLELFKELKKGNSFNLFLDGNTGAGKDKYEFITKLLNSTILVRSGIFRIMSLAKKPICIVIAGKDNKNRNVLTYYKPFYIENESLVDFNQKVHNIFEEHLIKRPGLWRLWFRHHKYIVRTKEKNENEVNPNELRWFHKEQPSLRLCLKNGNVYKTTETALK